MQLDLREFDELPELHNAAGRALFESCSAEVFPCDALALAVLDRSLGLVNGVRVLISNNGYTSGMALLRLQIDNILRLHGVIASGDAHGCAGKVLDGKHLRNLKNKKGDKMSDGYLVRSLSSTIPWIQDVYDTCSGFVHLSDRHVHYFLARCPVGPDGKRVFSIGDEDEHVPIESKRQLIKAFVGTTRGVTKLVTAWSQVRSAHGSNAMLKSKYIAAA